ncbi:hypothetical protein JCM11491_006884, partial [Sporobolomyces phaffii]
MAPSRVLYYSAYTVWVAVLVGVARRINRDVREPYMDEIFHVPQAQAYCRGQWRYWDAAITTPPGLYLVPAVLAHVDRSFQRLFTALPIGFNPCSLDALRSFNLAILAALPFLYSALLVAIRKPSVTSPPGQERKSTNAREEEQSRNSARWEGLVIAMMPVVGWWGWLYYTDLGSVATVLLSMRLSLARKYFASSVIGATSLLFRQTNVIWIAFIAGVAVVRELSSLEVTKKRSQLYDPLLSEARWIDLILTPYSLVYLALHDVPALLPVLAAYLPVFAGFLAFVKLNGGIVLGDKSNHVATVHVPQIYYFVAFSAVFVSPHLLRVRYVKKSLASLCGTTTRLLCSFTALAAMSWTIRNFTIAHPFLLADNRHFAFYLWRRILNVHPLARYALTPGYLFASRLLFEALIDAQTMRLSTFLLFSISTALVLVPTPLLEPRYFLTPFLFLRLYLARPASSTSTSTPDRRSTRRARVVLEAVLYVAVQAACVWLFLEKSFTWDVEVGPDGKGLQGRDAREVGKRQRFMW